MADLSLRTNLRSLSSDDLIRGTLHALAKEKAATLEIIDFLRETQRRMLYAELGFSSLFQYAVKHLGMSEGSAHRRIEAMRLCESVPEAKKELESGRLHFSNAARIQVALKKAKKTSKPEKLKLVQACLNLSQKECERTLAEAIPESVRTESQRAVVGGKTEVTLLLSRELKEKMDRLKALLSHANPEGSYLSLLERLVDQELDRQEKKRLGKSEKEKEVAVHEGTDGTSGEYEGHEWEVDRGKDISEKSEEKTRKKISGGPHQKEMDWKEIEQKETQLSLKVMRRKIEKRGSRDQMHSAAEGRRVRTPIPLAIRRLIWNRARGRCEYPNCDSAYFPEIDHIHPRSLGGTNDLRNLRVLCRTHNLYEARKKLGQELIERHSKKPWPQ